jgi:hypothetical protein
VIGSVVVETAIAFAAIGIAFLESDFLIVSF